MELEVLAVVLITTLMLLLFSGIPVAFALILSGILAFWLGAGSQGLQFVGIVFWTKTFTFKFLAVPLFVYMGFLLQESGRVDGQEDLPRIQPAVESNHADGDHDTNGRRLARREPAQEDAT